MHLFIRSVLAKNASCLPPAMRFAHGICEYVNKTYHVKMRFGVEVFGQAKINWMLDFESIDAALSMNQKMMTDTDYQNLLEKANELWVPGSMKDRLIRMAS